MRVLTIAAALGLSSTAMAGGVTFDVSGDCPGDVTFDIAASAGSGIAIVAAAGPGSTLIPGGACAGTELGVEGMTRMFGPIPTGPDGMVSFSLTAPDMICGMSMVAVDLATCAVSPVADFGGGVAPPDACEGGADLLDVSPGGDMVVCDDPSDATCEEDFGNLCPVGWHLCSQAEHQNRNAGWDYPTPGPTTLGTIHCRGAGGSGGAGHYTIDTGTLGDFEDYNCWYGSSRDTCVTGYGCNELSSAALCCAPSATCGNGVVDSDEELCDDGNLDETDDCLNNCTWKNPIDHGLDGFGC